MLAAFSMHHDLTARRPAPWYGPDIAAPLRSHRCFGDRGGRRRDERDAPYHALLMGYNKVPAWRVIASGKARAFGRRPWLGLRLDHLLLKV